MKKGLEYGMYCKPENKFERDGILLIAKGLGIPAFNEDLPFDGASGVWSCGQPGQCEVSVFWERSKSREMKLIGTWDFIERMKEEAGRGCGAHQCNRQPSASEWCSLCDLGRRIESIEKKQLLFDDILKRLTKLEKSEHCNAQCVLDNVVGIKKNLIGQQRYAEAAKWRDIERAIIDIGGSVGDGHGKKY